MHGCSISRPQFCRVELKASIKECACANLYTASDAVIISKRLMTKLQDKQYAMDLPLYEIFQWSTYHVKLSSGLISDLPPLPITYVDNSNPIEKYLLRSPFRRQLRDIQLTLSSATNLTFYTDGSLMDNQTTSSSMTFAFLQTNPRSREVSFQGCIENWPSSTRAELAAVVSAVLVSPPNCAVIINTDSNSIISHFNEISTNFHVSPRYIMKETDNLLWTILREVLQINNITLTFQKVRAHSGDLYNEKVDKLSKAAHNNQDINILMVNASQFDTMNVLPKWKKFNIETNFRKFIAQLSRNTGFEEWFNLNRNKKYRALNVDWQSTFYILSDEEPTSTTSFSASGRKRSHVKYLIEELPTVEHVKKRRPDLYQHWLCPLCDLSKETFNHVWLCPKVISTTRGLSILVKQQLRNLVESTVKEELPSRVHLLSSLNIDIDSIWSVVTDQHQLTFIDLIKGIIPLELFNSINRIANSRRVTHQILSKFFLFLYINVRDTIWSPRCERFLDIEILNNINSRVKRKKNNTSITYRPPLSTDDDDSTLELSNNGIIHFIRYNSSYLDFTQCVNHTLNFYFIFCLILFVTFI